MAYPTRESNNREGGSPNATEREDIADYMETTVDLVSAHEVGTSPLVDREHPHAKPENRIAGDHPHKDLNRLG